MLYHPLAVAPSHLHHRPCRVQRPTTALPQRSRGCRSGVRIRRRQRPVRESAGWLEGQALPVGLPAFPATAAAVATITTATGSRRVGGGGSALIYRLSFQTI